MAESSRKKTISSTMLDWSQLNEELLHIISKHLDNCFDVVHARSVCRSWRSSFPFPCCLLRTSYSLPGFADFPKESKDLCTLEKVPLFLFRVRPPPVAALLPSEYFLGGISSDDHMELSSPIQCSVKVKIPGSDPTFINMLDCQILSLGYQYRIIGWNPEDWTNNYKGMAFLLLNEEGGGEFIVLLNYTKFLLVLRSAEKKWMRLMKISSASCSDLAAFRGRFYAVFHNGDVFVIDPYSLEATPVTPLMPSVSWSTHYYLVPSGNDELFLVEKIFGRESLLLSKCRVRRLDAEAGKWVEVTDLGNLVLFVGLLGNVSCSAKELPGVSGNSILFSSELGTVTHFYKYGPLTGRSEDDLNCWRFSIENRVRLLNTFPVVALRLQC